MFAQALHQSLGNFGGAGAADEGCGAGDDGVVGEGGLLGGEHVEVEGDLIHSGFQAALLLTRGQ